MCSDSSLFIYKSGAHVAYLLVYADDIILTALSTTLLCHVVDHLCQAFVIKDLGALHFFLGIQVRRDAAGFYLNLAQYAEDILERAGMTNCKPATTPVEAKPKCQQRMVRWRLMHHSTAASLEPSSISRSRARTSPTA